MTAFIARPPSAKEIEDGTRKVHMAFVGGDAPPVLIGTSGLVTAGIYFFRQATPADEWVIAHGLGVNPTISVQNTSGSDQLAVVDYISINELSIRFSEPTQGHAWLNTTDF